MTRIKLSGLQLVAEVQTCLRNGSELIKARTRLPCDARLSDGFVLSLLVEKMQLVSENDHLFLDFFFPLNCFQLIKSFVCFFLLPDQRVHRTI